MLTLCTIALQPEHGVPCTHNHDTHPVLSLICSDTSSQDPTASTTRGGSEHRAHVHVVG